MTPARTPASTVGELIAQQARQRGDAPFLFFPERGLTLHYAELEATVNQTARLLQTLGVQHSDKVALLLPNTPEFVQYYWGAMRLGAVACPINTLLKGPEIAYICEHSESTVLVITQAFFAELNAVAAELNAMPTLKHIIVVSDPLPEGSAEADASSTETLAFRSLIAHEQALATCDANASLPEKTRIQSRIQPKDDAMMIYTSGTTGKPKGVLLTHHNLLKDAEYIRDWFSITPETRFMCILPLFHVNGEVVTLMTPLLSGASVVLNRKFSASRFWPTIEQFRVNLFSTVPTILSVLLAAPKPTEDISSLRFGICGAAPLPVEVHKQFEATFGVPIYEGYGLSETTCYSTFNPPDVAKRIIGSIGVAVGNDVAIWDENNQPVPIGDEGEIVVRGENVMKGYFKNPEATEKAFAGGWFHTGDWGKVDDNGFFYILDRVKDMIIRGGENIYPREVDEVLYTHPAVEAAATIGVPDAKYGERVKSYVVLKAGQTASEQALIDFCLQRLATYKCPESIAFIPEIPKGPTGKLLRRALREMAT